MPFLAPVVGAIGSAFAAVGTFIGGLGFVGKALIGIGLNLAARALFKPERAQAAQPVTGVEFERQYGENVSRKVVCGRFAMAGHDCYVNTYGSSNSTLQQVFVFSDYPCTSLDKVFADGKALTLGAADPALGFPVTSGDYAGRMWFKFYDGTQTAADGRLVSNANPASRWTANHVGTGMAYLIVTMVYDQEKLASFPDFFFEGKGAKLYDWRKDSTVGGLGSHRWNDYSTYEFTENPIVMDYNYRRGFAINGDLFCGMEMAANDLPLDKYTSAANICDEPVAYGTRYRCAAMLDCGKPHGDNIEALMTSCGGMVIDAVDGSWPLVGSDQPILETITDDDLVIGEAVRFQKLRSMSELVNSVSGTHPDPDNLWSPVGYDVQTDAATVAIDRRTRDVSMDFPTVPYRGQANQLAAIYFSENRFEATADITVWPRYQHLKAGDWIRWNSAKYGDRTYIVTEASLKSLSADGPRNVVLSLQERDGSIYDAVGVTVPVYPLPPGEPLLLSVLNDFAVVGVIGQGNDGRAYPALRASWAAIDDATVTAVEIEWWSEADPTNRLRRTVPADTQIALLTEGIVSQTDYRVRHRLVTDPARTTVWSAEVPVISPTVPNNDVTVGLGQVQADIGDTLKDTVEALLRLRNIVDAGMGNAAVDTAESYIQRTTQDRQIGQARAAITRETQLRVSADEALAQDIQAVTASLGDLLAEGLLSFQSVADPTGALAQIDFLVRASTADAFQQAGISLQAGVGGDAQVSRIVMQAGQIILTDGTAENLPFVYENGELKLAIANIGTVTAGTLQSPDGLVVFDLANGTLTMDEP